MSCLESDVLSFFNIMFHRADYLLCETLLPVLCLNTTLYDPRILQAVYFKRGVWLNQKAVNGRAEVVLSHSRAVTV